jgi:hypothetical protein
MDMAQHLVGRNHSSALRTLGRSARRARARAAVPRSALARADLVLDGGGPGSLGSLGFEIALLIRSPSS